METEEIEKLVELKKLNFITLEAILFVKVNQKCGLQKATKIVMVSEAFKNG